MDREILGAASSWIWVCDAPAENCYAQFRQNFEAFASCGAILYLTVEGTYAAFLNEAHLPSVQQPDLPACKSVQRIPLDSWLRSGQNTLELQVWYPGTDTSVSRRETPGVRFEIRCGEQLLCASGTQTAARMLSGYQSGPHGNITPQLGFGFTWRPAPEFPWRSAEATDKTARLMYAPLPEPTIGTLKTGRIAAQGVFRLNGGSDPGMRQQLAWLSCREPAAAIPPEGLRLSSRDADGSYLVLDLGCTQEGYVVLEAAAPQEADVTIGYGEHLDDLRVRTSVGGRCFAVTCGIGTQRRRFVHWFRRLGCRYLQFFFHSSTATVYAAGIYPEVYPVDTRPAFACSNLLHERIWDVSRQTLLSCMHGHFEDCPWREQALYGFDGRVEMLCAYYAFGDYAMARRSLELLAHSQREDGLLELCAPARIPVNIPGFSLAFVVAVQEYCLYSGDLAFGRSVWEVITRILQRAAQQLQNGICRNDPRVGAWNFYEWNDLLDGMPLDHPQPLPLSYDAPLQLMLLLATQRAELLAQWLELDTQALRSLCRTLINGLEAFWDEKAGAYASFIRDGRHVQYAQLVQALALYTGACPAEREAALREDLAQGRWLPVTLGMSIFKYEALLQDAGQYAGNVFREVAQRWGAMLFRGAETFWEREDGADAFDRAGSLCHGWGALPSYLYGRYALGAYPVRPGEWTAEPDKRTGLHGVSGLLLTPAGELKIERNRTEEKSQ